MQSWLKYICKKDCAIYVMPTVLTGCCVCVMNPTEEATCKVVGSLAHSSMHKVHMHIILYE